MNVITPKDVSKNMYVGSVMVPCGACREFVMQLGAEVKNIEVLLNNNGKTVKLKDFMAEYPY